MTYRRIVVVLLLALILTGCSSIPYNDIFSSDYAEQVYEEQAEQNRNTEDDAYSSFSDKSSSIYYETFDRVTAPSSGNDDKEPLSEQIFRGGFQVYSTIRNLAPFLFLGSIGIGLLLVIFCRHNKALRSLGLYGFIIGIPVFLLVFIYGIGIVMDMFLF